jgi:hypothetical protein
MGGTDSNATSEGIMKIGVIFVLLLLSPWAAFGDDSQSQSQAPSGLQTVCAGNLIPSNMAVTATGTSSNCPASCTTRSIERVRGDMMVICAHQPIPTGYTLDSITSNAECECLGSEDNAYVIKKSSPEW